VSGCDDVVRGENENSVLEVLAFEIRINPVERGVVGQSAGPSGRGRPTANRHDATALGRLGRHRVPQAGGYRAWIRGREAGVVASVEPLGDHLSETVEVAGPRFSATATIPHRSAGHCSHVVHILVRNPAHVLHSPQPCESPNGSGLGCELTAHASFEQGAFIVPVFSIGLLSVCRRWDGGGDVGSLPPPSVPAHLL